MTATLERAFILHQRHYRETSVLLDILTEHHGVISAVAKGVRQKNSRYRALLQPFMPLLIAWYGKNELVTLTIVESQDIYLSLRGDCLLSGLYLNELLINVLHKNDPHPAIYAIYHETLLALQNSKLDQKILRFFEKNLLKEIGYELPFHKVAGEDKFYSFHPEHGFEQSDKDEGGAIFLGKNLLAIARDELELEPILRDAKRLMRIALMFLLGNKVLESRKLFIK